ncbi:aminotransferase class III-fold pyridoxal phosphate-dependent enzyme [bacterium]|nr:aminotransferase class III-fold pyridoxal phosphate-dependent enzyme [bacterium]
MDKFSTFHVFCNSILELLEPIGIKPSWDGSNLIIPLSEESELFWKQSKDISKLFSTKLQKIPNVKIQDQAIHIPKSTPAKAQKQLRLVLENCCSLLCKENIFSKKIWGQATEFCAKGFDETNPSLSKDSLSSLYEEDFVVAEKKSFVIDLNKSKGARMISIDPEPMSFFDGAAQIASLALGYNDSKKNSLYLKPELLEFPQKFEGNDIYEGFCHLLKTQSSLKHCYVVNSGAEAVETALKACQLEYPNRSKVIAFKGSFHGRTLLSLHCTYNPAKRIPFEIFPDLVKFVEFPEDKQPDQERIEPENWLKLWSLTEEKSFEEDLARINTDSDEVIESEIQALLEIRNELKSKSTLALISEPMLCEGGDRYGSNRFFRALRVLTRSYDTALIMDEVQTGFGLGSEFFWHKIFKFETPEGKPDQPDCVCLAKKAQAAACLSNFEIKDHKIDSSLASLYRGYLQGQEVLRSDISVTERKSHRFLKLLGQHVAKGEILYPRAKGLAFAFDVKNADVAKALVAARFRNGLLFYPAGDFTLRFRMLLGANDHDYAELFTGIRKCFIELEKSGMVKEGKSLAEWNEVLKEQQEHLNQNTISYKTPFAKAKIPCDFEEVKNLSTKDWIKIFRTLSKNIPQLLYSKHNCTYSLEKLHKESLETLWSHYLKNIDFSFVDFLWQSSRMCGPYISQIETKQLKELSSQITALEELVYEPARRATMEDLISYSKESESILHVCLDKQSNNQLLAISVLAPLKLFGDVGLIDTDPNQRNPKHLYSADLTVNPNAQGQGLGYRLKCEQIISSWCSGAVALRSRNRFPQSSGMIQLNQRLGSIIISELANAYGPKSSPAKYQSLTLPKKNQSIRIGDERLGALQNKGSLANFVSPSYIRNTQTLKQVLPKPFQHIYLASGKAEATDKIVKLLKGQRPEANICLSINGDDFGNTTAASRSLGGDGTNSFFDWPAFDINTPLSQIEEYLSFHESKQILGFFMEPKTNIEIKKKDDKKIRALVKLFKTHSIPVVFHETGSCFGAFDSKQFIVADKFNADISYFWAAPHLAAVATRKEFFNNQPLAMISTWDGDETGLHILRNRIENWLWK